MKLLLILLLLICSCERQKISIKNQPSSLEHLQGERYEERKKEQETLRKALALLPYFDGDGQVMKNNTYHGSCFFWDETTIMTNQHVLHSEDIGQLKFIDFKNIVFYKSSSEKDVKNYIKSRNARAPGFIAEGKKILQKRINNLEDFKHKDDRLNNILLAYKGDLQDLEDVKQIKFEDIKFIPIEDSIDYIFRRTEMDPDIAIIKLKNPLSNYMAVKDEWLAAKNLYDPIKHGLLYPGTPIFIAGFGQEIGGSLTDKNKSIKFFPLNMLQGGIFFTYPLILFNLQKNADPWELERDFYYQEPDGSHGDSGSRIYAFLNHNDKLSSFMMPLKTAKITIGIMAGQGIVFNNDDLILFNEKLDIKYVHKDLLPTKSSNLDYLFNFKEDDDRFKSFIKNYLLYKIIKNNWLFKHERSYLWTVIFFKSLENLYYVKNKEYEVLKDAILKHFETQVNFSPSELREKEWQDSLLNSRVLTAEQKDWLKKAFNDQFSVDLGDDYLIKLKNVKKPIKLKDYLKVLEDFVDKKSHNRTEYYDTVAAKVPDESKIFDDVSEILQIL